MAASTRLGCARSPTRLRARLQGDDAEDSTTCCRRRSPPRARRSRESPANARMTCRCWARSCCTTAASREMKTGEGKTLVAALALYLNALEGRGAPRHRERLPRPARRAVVRGGAAHPRVRIGVLQHDSGVPLHARRGQSRRGNGAPDAGPATRGVRRRHHLRHEQRVRLRLPARQHGADEEDKVQRTRHFAIVDEADSVLIDEARTPLIISGPAAGRPFVYPRFARLTPTLPARRALHGRRAHALGAPDRGGHRALERGLGIQTSTRPRTSG